MSPIGGLLLLENYDVTEEFWKYLLIPKKILMRKPKVKYQTNNIQFKNIVLYGFQGSGKTETARGICYQIVKFYKPRNVNCVYTEDGDLEAILNYGFEDKLVNVIYIDNLTLQKVSRDTIKKYFRCRHILPEKYDRYNGYIISLISLHRFWSVPAELRANMNALLVKDSSLNPYDRNFLRRLFGKDLIEFLDKIEYHRVYKPEIMEYSLFYSKFITGIVKIPMAKRNYMKDVRQKQFIRIF